MTFGSVVIPSNLSEALNTSRPRKMMKDAACATNFINGLRRILPSCKDKMKAVTFFFFQSNKLLCWVFQKHHSQCSGQSETLLSKSSLPNALNWDGLPFQTKLSQRQSHGTCCSIREHLCYPTNSRRQYLLGSAPRSYICTMAAIENSL